MTMSAIAIVRRLISRVRVIVNEEASFPEYTLQLGDVTSVTDGQTDRQTDRYCPCYCIGIEVELYDACAINQCSDSTCIRK